MSKRDGDLVTAFLGGKEEAFEELMSRHQQQVFYVVKSLVFDVDEARDITQKAFIAAFKNLKRLRNRQMFRHWLYRIAVNHARDHLKSRKEKLEYQGWMEPDCTNVPEKRIIERDLVKQVKDMLKGLPMRQQEVVSLRIFHGLSFKEIAEILEIKEATARTNFHFGIKLLRKGLVERGISHEV